jgi:hypothetical protein
MICSGPNAYIGSLRGTTIASFISPVPGLPMVHWNEHYLETARS